MYIKHYLLPWAIFGFLICLVRAQGSSSEVTPLVEDEGDDDGSFEEGYDPADTEYDPNENPDAVMTRLGGVASIDEFMNLMRDEDGNPMAPHQLFEDFETLDDGGKLHIRGGGRMAVPDECSPRNVTVVLDTPSDEPNTVYFPQCTRMERCGGCVGSAGPSPHLECKPAYTERVSLQVVKARIPFPGASHLSYSGFANVIVERHVRCWVKCNLNQHKCGPLKRFRQALCDCQCKRWKRCRRPDMRFSGDSCTCECINQRPCCPEGTANCGMVWQRRTCSCVLDSSVRVISGNDIYNRTQEDWDNYYRRLNETTDNNGAVVNHEVMMSDQPAVTSQQNAAMSPAVQVDDVDNNNPDLPEVDDANADAEDDQNTLSSSSSSSPSSEAPTTTTTTTTTTTPFDPCVEHTCPANYNKSPRGNLCACVRRTITRPRGPPRSRTRGPSRTAARTRPSMRRPMGSTISGGVRGRMGTRMRGRGG